MSQTSSAVRMASSSATSSSGKAPNGTGSPPASVTAAAMMAPLLSYTRAGPSVPPGATSSSPVESTATLGLRTTSTVATPHAASMPISRDESGVLRRSTTSPRAMSEPA